MTASPTPRQDVTVEFACRRGKPCSWVCALGMVTTIGLLGLAMA